MDYLAAQDFPGNVRQLESLCHWLTVMAPTQTIEVADLPSELKPGGGKVAESDWVGALECEIERAFARGETAVLDKFAQAFERAVIARALARTGGRRIEAANLLGMGRNTITRKIAELGLEAKGPPDEAAVVPAGGCDPDSSSGANFRNPECNSYCGMRRRVIKYPPFSRKLQPGVPQ